MRQNRRHQGKDAARAASRHCTDEREPRATPFDQRSRQAHRHLPRHLQRIFLQYFRLAPSRFYQNHRLQCARRLIRQTSMTVTEIGMATGFKTTSHFSESGRAETGCPAAAPLANSSVHEILRQAHWPHQIWRRHRLGWHRSRSAWGQTEPLDQGEDRSGSPPTAALSCCRSIGCDVPEPATCLQSGFACQVARPSQNSIYAKS